LQKFFYDNSRVKDELLLLRVATIADKVRENNKIFYKSRFTHMKSA